MTKNTDTSMLALLANEVGYDPIEGKRPIDTAGYAA
jgi:hypothetical protein